MAKILSFKAGEPEIPLVALFDMACDLIFKPVPGHDSCREVGRLVQKAVICSGENPHHFSAEKLGRLELLLSS